MSKTTTIKPLGNNEISVFASQMSLMMSAGISIDEALRLVESDSESAEGKEVIKSIYTTLEEGNSLAYSMRECNLFPKYVIDMVSIGEQTGKLDTVFASLAEYYEREESIAEGIKQAVTYPFIMIGLMLCVIFVLVAKVLPIFRQVYQQLGSDMSGLSGSILRFGSSMERYSIVFVAVLVILACGYFYFSHAPKGKAQMESFASVFPLTRNLFERIAAGHFASGMALALASGFTTIEAVDMVKELITNKVYLSKIDQCRNYMTDGVVFADAVVKAGIFSGTYGRMVSIGFKSGKTDEVMSTVAARYEIETDREISHFVSILEPTLVAVLSIIVGMILLSVMLPLMGIMSSIG